MFSLEHLLNKSVHLGHKKKFRHRNASAIIKGTRYKNDILDLNETVTTLNRILPIIFNTSLNNNYILIITELPTTTLQTQTNPFSQCCFSTNNWIPGTLSNFKKLYYKKTINQHRNITLPAFPKLVILGRPNQQVFSETVKLKIPTIAVTDSNTDITKYIYPIPGNDDSIFTQKTYATFVRNVILYSFLQKNKLLKQTKNKWKKKTLYRQPHLYSS